MFTRILIANRGEIACRVARTARAMGIGTVAVYAPQDAGALHVEAADEAVALGGTTAADNYLNSDKLIAAAKATGAEAIHPGYGFLSESSAFSRRCEQENIRFIGPDAEAIRIMGCKSAARASVAGFAVPILPGYDGDEQHTEALTDAAAAIGYPLMIKATAGGGGKGMRTVEQADAFAAALAAVQRESQNAFGDARVMLEKYLPAARHIEVQIFADTHGNIVHLFERDCSMQRRNQKVIEEAPAPDLAADIRQRMFTAAIDCARAVNYVGAGTVEFLLAPEQHFYFMEMNTRLQVEHPVTEMITGLDLVEWQLKVAAGESLPLKQEQITCTGHAMEARIYAENPARDFLPASGTIGLLQPPGGRRIRIDTGVRVGDLIGIHYDPMIAKLICYGETRASANRTLTDALGQYHILGLPTNISFLRRLSAAEDFRRARLSTRFIEQNAPALVAETISEQTLIAMTAAALMPPRPTLDSDSPWTSIGGWYNGLPGRVLRTIRAGDRVYELALTRDHDQLRVECAGETIDLTLHPTASGELDFRHGEHHVRGRTLLTAEALSIDAGDAVLHLSVVDRSHPSAIKATASGTLQAPMPGLIIATPVQAGDSVAAGDTLMILEAMKMEHRIQAPVAGTVTALYFKEGERVQEGEQLVHLEEQTA